MKSTPISRRAALSSAAALASAPALLADGEPGRSRPQLLRRPYQPAAGGPEREHYVYLPSGFSSEEGRKWPVMLFLHGNGERGDGQGRARLHDDPRPAPGGLDPRPRPALRHPAAAARLVHARQARAPPAAACPHERPAPSAAQRRLAADHDHEARGAARRAPLLPAGGLGPRRPRPAGHGRRRPRRLSRRPGSRLPHRPELRRLRDLVAWPRLIPSAGPP